MHYHLIVFLSYIYLAPSPVHDCGLTWRLGSDSRGLWDCHIRMWVMFFLSTKSSTGIKSPMMIQIIQFCFCNTIEESQLPYQNSIWLRPNCFPRQPSTTSFKTPRAMADSSGSYRLLVLENQPSMSFIPRYVHLTVSHSPSIFFTWWDLVYPFSEPTWQASLCPPSLIPDLPFDTLEGDYERQGWLVVEVLVVSSLSYLQVCPSWSACWWPARRGKRWVNLAFLNPPCPRARNHCRLWMARKWLTRKNEYRKACLKIYQFLQVS